jgi:apolipoprotein N-acyltransferase
MSRKKTIIYIWLLSLLSSLLLSVPFLMPHGGIVAFFALVPLLMAEYLAGESKIKFFWIIYYLSFLLWNLFTTYWVSLATMPGAIAAITLNALQMSLIFALFRWMKRNTCGFLPYLFFVIAWLAWEHSYFNWQVSWPWLVLGNSFATSIQLIQWYEFTGTLGGSLWILLVNVLLFRILMLLSSRKRYFVSLSSLAFLVVLPMVFSAIMYKQYGKNLSCEKRDKIAFSILQPNIDPYNDKFGGMSQREQTMTLLSLAKEAVVRPFEESVSNCVILAPETFFSPSGEPGSIFYENNPLANYSFGSMYNYLASINASADTTSHINYSLIVGAVTEKIYSSVMRDSRSGKPIPPSETARSFGDGMHWYDHYNAAVFVNMSGKIDYYYKSKLVILAESTPFTGILKPMEKFAIDLGGAVGSFGTQKERTVFKTGDKLAKIGTAICYESVYGDFYRGYVLKGAQVMTIITNDGWWGDTPGYVQHLNYASLRAIETRRSIARCANTGISAFISERGEILSSTKWWKPAYLNALLPLNDNLTVFVKYGDIIGRVSVFIFMLFILLGIVRSISNKVHSINPEHK